MGDSGATDPAGPGESLQNLLYETGLYDISTPSLVLQKPADCYNRVMKLVKTS